MVTDRKLAVSDDGIAVDYYVADVSSQSDYYPFGMLMNSDDGADYRYGLNGMEKDDEVSGDGNSYDFGARFYNPRVGRWLSGDPLESIYSDLSTYTYSRDNPILFKDIDGKQIIIFYIDKNGAQQSYQYGSGLKKPNNKFVRKTVRTLRKLERRYDPMDVIETAKKNEDVIAIMEDPNWEHSSSNIDVGNAKRDGTTDENGVFTSDGSVDKEPIPAVTRQINWNPNSGLISPDGLQTQSAAQGLLHEVAHWYYTKFDPEGHQKELASIRNLDIPDSEKEKLIREFIVKMNNEVGDYDNYADKWIINSAEAGFKRSWKRKSHSKGHMLKTKGGTFSKRGKEYTDHETGKVKSVKSLKNSNSNKSTNK